MKKFLMVLVLIFALVFPSYAAKAPPDIYVEYSLGVTDITVITNAEFLIQLGSDPLDLTHIMDIPIANVGEEVTRSFGTGPLDSLPIGKEYLYYIRTTDTDGDTALSDGYPFKITGKPEVKFMRKDN